MSVTADYFHFITGLYYSCTLNRVADK